ncbi:hypothetical protein AMES_5419 [Amycolatopsis mediterranei S699]|uniref:Uncharacterized protein n=2 Tax=Amycolatopsis mediterranei TaxID=33910 RepID=A0A0H3DCA0_AMYMU|nr:hypothetical protein [Amycolatopsis mediterranei]ADJ47244.1 hypothetical protein AMED_5485 [Amycolatopsis mediterranei U32]AEK44069.1 hypothetical protein RAM_27960 [Amycolatopsis mediterranei S699]AFO78955.1 hypothetical protein AMES_5419 [Amycolatopsis mediterranei S699]AGT86083.1 hypothetical protein B737_5419 [Amycolatopsis mediterranei RB]KDO04793.1 hypothetical protein DV26_42070 [Amycolatopsis mediterranei]
MSAGDAAEPPPEPLDSAILFAPAVADIHLSDVPPAREFLAFAGKHHLSVSTVPYVLAVG